jgi:alpha-tubulin suppressor-like RCC1 family protein
VLGLGHSEGRATPEKLPGIENIVKVASGWDHCLALDKSGALYSWGSGQNG